MFNSVEKARLEIDLFHKAIPDSIISKEETDALYSVVKAFANQGHSGASAGYARPILVSLLESLLAQNNITSLTGSQEEWTVVGETYRTESSLVDSITQYQNVRDYSVFKKVFSNPEIEPLITCKNIIAKPVGKDYCYSTRMNVVFNNTSYWLLEIVTDINQYKSSPVDLDVFETDYGTYITREGLLKLSAHASTTSGVGYLLIEIPGELYGIAEEIKIKDFLDILSLSNGAIKLQSSEWGQRRFPMVDITHTTIKEV